MYTMCLKSGSQESFAGANIYAPGKVSKFVMKLVIMIKFQNLSILDKLYFARVEPKYLLLIQKDTNVFINFFITSSSLGASRHSS